MEIATFGAGCFWGVEAAFASVSGVTSTEVGYAGGSLPSPTYGDVCRGDTGHTEVVRVTYDPERVSYETLLDAFWECHDPTQVDRQGPDVGFQYRSVIFCENERQFVVAEASKLSRERGGRYTRSVATAVETSREFYRAEEYHQRYLEKRGLATCHI